MSDGLTDHLVEVKNWLPENVRAITRRRGSFPQAERGTGTIAIQALFAEMVSAKERHLGSVNLSRYKSCYLEQTQQ